MDNKEKKERYLERILLQMIKFSELDFENILDVDLDEDLGEIIPGIAVGVKILGEELDYKIKELQKRDEERDLLVKEIHHRVKNNLQLLSSIYNMDIRRETSELVKERVIEMNTRVLTISNIHEALYKSDNFSMVDFQTYCMNLCKGISSIYESGRDIRIEYDLEPGIQFGIDETRYLGLIINEVISNCYKHQFLDQYKGVIKVIFKTTNSHYSLELVDNGKNKPASETADTTGNKLIKGFVLQLKGQLTINSDNGYSVKLVFPKK